MSEHVPGPELPRVVADVDEEGPRCSGQPGQAHSNPQEHPVPANNATDLIDGMEVGVVKRGGWRGGEIVCFGSKSKGGRSGPLIDPTSSLLVTLGGRLEAQQLPRAGGDSSGLERVAKEGEVLELIGVAARERFRGLVRFAAPDERLH